MNIYDLQQALAVMNKDGKSGEVFAYHDELHLFPMTDKFSKEEVEVLERLGFHIGDDGCVWCFT